MYTKPSLLLATALTFASVAIAAPVTQFAPHSISRALDTVQQPDGSGVVLVQNRGRGGGGQRAGWRSACGWRSASGRRRWATGGRREPWRQFQQQRLPPRRSEQSQHQRQPECKRQPECQRQRQSERECLRRRGRLLQRQLQHRTQLGWRRGGRRGWCCGWCGREFRRPIYYLCSTSADLSAGLRRAATVMAPQRPS